MNKYNLNKEEIIDQLGYDEKTRQYILDNLIFLAVAGSHAYGLNTETSDIDIRGIFIADKTYVIGDNRIEQYQNSTNDTVIYELKFALHLIADQNPNMLDLLYIDEEDILYATKEYWNIRKHRDELLSSLCKFRFSGYAISQLKRIKGHNRWLIKEQEGKFDKPINIIDYCYVVNHDGRIIKDKDKILPLSATTKLSKIKKGIYNIWNTVESVNKPWINNNFISVLDTSEIGWIHEGVLFVDHGSFDIDLKEYNSWKTWKENRNKVRAALEEKFSYDSKHAMHTIRLLYMGVEILEGKGVIVKRPDRDFLLSIRNGKYTYDEIVAMSEELDKVTIEKAYENTKLQHSINKDLVNKLLIETYEFHWNKIRQYSRNKINGRWYKYFKEKEK